MACLSHVKKGERAPEQMCDSLREKSSRREKNEENPQQGEAQKDVN